MKSSSKINSQFTCTICGDGYNQKSRLDRHMATSHPPNAPSAADVEKVLAGIRYPKTKQELVQYAYASQVSKKNKAPFELIKSLPERTYRDSAEVAIALGELKSAKSVRSAKEVAMSEKPSKRGGRAAITSPLISAAGIANVLAGIKFPRSKDDLVEYAENHLDNREEVEFTNEVLSILDKLPTKEYSNMADVEHEIGRLK
jgi:HEAT repeat protein